MATLTDTDWDSRFEAQTSPSGETMWTREELRNAGANIATENTWTILDVDGLYIAPGYHFVNSFGYVVTDVPWVEADTENEWVWA